MTNNIRKYIAIEILLKSIYLVYDEHISFDDIYEWDNNHICDACDTINVKVKTNFGKTYYISLPDEIVECFIWKDKNDFIDEI